MRKFSKIYKSLIAVFFLLAYGNVYFSYLHYTIDALLDKPHEHSFSLFENILSKAETTSNTSQQSNISGNNEHTYLKNMPFSVFFSLVKPEVAEASVLKNFNIDMVKHTMLSFILLKIITNEYFISCHSPPIITTDIRLRFHSFLI